MLFDTMVDCNEVNFKDCKMKHILIMTFIALTFLSGCRVMPPGHDPRGPGNSENAPGHNKGR